MFKYTIQVDGMMCGMCEAHVNDAVRRDFENIKKVSSSHAKGETVVLSEQELDEDALVACVAATGYEVKGVTKGQAKKGLFGWS